MTADPVGRDFWIRHHPYGTLGAEPDETARVDVDDSRIVMRVVAAYRRTSGGDYYGHDSMWKAFRDDKQLELHELLMHGRLEEIAEALRSPKDNFLFRGFETLTRETYQRYSSNPNLRCELADRLHDLLIRLAEALAVLRVENPEGGPWLENVRLPVDEVLNRIEAKLAIALTVPWFYAGLVGLKTGRGIFGHRMIHAAYCAYRIRQLTAGNFAARVLEIGAGLGHLARYSWMMGIRDFTIVDLPLTNVSQGYFLMRTLGEDAVQLEGEPDPGGSGRIRVRSPRHLDESARYELVVNIDSMTEFGRDIAAGYLARIFAMSGCLFSVNHEGNPFTVSELVRNSFPDLAIERFPYWMRHGYVEEIVRRR